MERTSSERPNEAAGVRPHLNCRKACGRAELLLLVEKLQMDKRTAARLLGYDPPDTDSERPIQENGQAHPIEPTRPTKPREHAEIEVKPPPLWRVIGPVVRPYDPAAQQIPALLTGPAYSDSDLAGKARRPLPHVPIIPKSRLGLVLRSLLLLEEPGKRIDEPRLVELLARCVYPTKVPRRRRSVWPSRIQIFWDQSQLLWPFRADQFEVVEWLRRWRGAQGLEEIIIDHRGNIEAFSSDESERPLKPRSIDNATTLLGLSDLGCGKLGDPRTKVWWRLGREASRCGARLRSLVLSSPERWDAPLVSLWGGIAWGQARATGRKSAPVAGIGECAREQSVKRLFELLAPAVRIEWGLLGAARRRLLAGRSDVLTELDASTDPSTTARNPLGFAISAESRRELLELFARHDETTCRNFKQLLTRHHDALSPVVLAEELMALGDETSKLEGAERLAKHLRLLFARGEPTEAELAHVKRFAARQSVADWSDEVKAVLWALHHARGAQFDEPLPEGLSIEQVKWALNRVPPPTQVSLWQRGQYLYVVPARDRDIAALERSGAHLADVPVAVRQLELEWRGEGRRLRVERLRTHAADALNLLGGTPKADRVTIRSDLATLELVLEQVPSWSESLFRDSEGLSISASVRAFTMEPRRVVTGRVSSTVVSYPPWATRLDKDVYGLYAVLDLAPGFETRLRWIPPGRFFMGSPRDEAGRFESEGPQHWVELTQGFWLADAPCTQIEWQAITGNNPSAITDTPLAPVEQVSWDDCQEYLKKINAQWPSLGARLPSEAEWEYACRAGKLGAFNSGSDCTEPEGRDPALLKLGWFRSNSGGRTHAVRNPDFAPNLWGLFDMHGNVWEWCQDRWAGKYGAHQQRDPTGPADGTDRVVRGGSWSVRARFCRSAHRHLGHPSERVPNLGFRFAAGQVGQVGRAEREQGQEQTKKGKA